MQVIGQKADYRYEADKAVKDILLSCLPILISGLVISYCFFGIEAGISFLTGALVSVANFIFLKLQVQVIVDSTINSRRLPLWAAFGYIGRFFIMGFALFLLGHFLGYAGILAGGAGLFLVRAGIFIYGLKGNFKI